MIHNTFIPLLQVGQYVTVDAARDARETEQELMETIFRQSRKRKKEDVPARRRERKRYHQGDSSGFYYFLIFYSVLVAFVFGV